MRDACHERKEIGHPQAWVLRLLEPLLLTPIDAIPTRVVGRLFAFFGSFALVDASQHTDGSIIGSVEPLRKALQTFMANVLRTYEQGNPFRWNRRPECMQAAFALVVCADKNIAALMCKLAKASVSPAAETTTDALCTLATDVGIPSSRCSLDLQFCKQWMLTCKNWRIHPQVQILRDELSDFRSVVISSVAFGQRWRN